LALNQSIFLIYLPFTEVCVENYKNPMVTKTDRNENVLKIPPPPKKKGPLVPVVISMLGNTGPRLALENVL
jgi:hypothetical protein